MMPHPNNHSFDASCVHETLIVKSSRHATVAGYTQPTQTARAAACTPSGRIKEPEQNKSKNKTKNPVQLRRTAPKASIIPSIPSPFTFPAPLVLPEDDIALDPRYPPQSLLSWLRSRDRNPVTRERNTIYVVAVSDDYDDDTSFIKEWIRPYQPIRPKTGYKKAEYVHETSLPRRPHVDAVVDYLAAFYHGLPVRKLSTDISFENWNKPGSYTRQAGRRWKHSYPDHVGLNIGEEIVGIRVRKRRWPDPFMVQLNLNDLIDAAISLLPADAYALLMLVDHDIYEGDEEFTCGRAYGGSRVAVVSSARYNPALDEQAAIEREHAWPASHCASFVERCCADADADAESDEDAPLDTRLPTKGKFKARSPKHSTASQDTSANSLDCPDTSPLQQTISAFNANPQTSNNTYGLYLARLVRTAAHELGHCFGIDHCMYYACCMQGTASIAEDLRQPPYLCPVDLEKLLRATGSSERKRNVALLEFCKGWSSESMFRAYEAWIRARLDELEAGSIQRGEWMDGNAMDMD
jgi:archaemetzincin